MSLLKKQKAVSTVNAETTFHGDSQIPDHPRLIRVESSNENFFYRLRGDVATDQCEVIVEPPCNVIIIRDGVASEVLGPGRYPLFKTEVKGLIFKHKKRILSSITIFVFNPKLAYQSLWGTPAPIAYRDPETQESVSFRANGQFDIRIADGVKFFETLVGSTQKFTVEDFQERVIVSLAAYFKNEAVKVILDKKINYIDLQGHELDIAEGTRVAIDKLFQEEYGLTIPVFSIKELVISDEEKAAVEGILKGERLEAKAKKDAKEIAAELERLADKEYEREMALNKLEKEDHEKYLEVLKILGWPLKEHKDGKTFCAKCGEPVSKDDEFCPSCGEELKKDKQRVCPKCGKVIKGKGKFCPHCGAELK